MWLFMMTVRQRHCLTDGLVRPISNYDLLRSEGDNLIKDNHKYNKMINLYINFNLLHYHPNLLHHHKPYNLNFNKILKWRPMDDGNDHWRSQWMDKIDDLEKLKLPDHKMWTVLLFHLRRRSLPRFFENVVQMFLMGFLQSYNVQIHFKVPVAPTLVQFQDACYREGTKDHIRTPKVIFICMIPIMDANGSLKNDLMIIVEYLRGAHTRCT